MKKKISYFFITLITAVIGAHANPFVPLYLHSERDRCARRYLSLHGIVSIGEQRAALIKNNEKLVMVRPGDMVEDYVTTSIDRHNVYLVRNKKRLTLSFDLK